MKTPRRIATSLIALSLLVGVLVPVMPQRAEAVFGVGDVVFDPTNLVENAISAAKSGWLMLKETSLDTIAWKIGREMIASISKSTIKWINSGFNGSPAYVTDLQRTLLSVSDKVANDFFRELTVNKSIDSPFRNIIAASLRDQYYRSTGRNSYFNLNQYTLNQFSQNPAAFLGGDFSQGGLRAWHASTLNCQNNALCARQAAEAQLYTRTGQAQGGTLRELDWGRGFRSDRGPCTTNSASSGTQNSGTGSVTAGTASTHSGTQTGTTGGTNAGTGTVTGQVSLSNVDNCVGQPIINPGANINAALERVTGNELDQLNIADEFNEVIAALMSQMLKTMLGSGGLAGLSKPSSGGGKSFIDQVTGTDQTTTGGGGGGVTASFAEMINTQQTQMAAYNANWMTIKSAALDAIEACSVDGSAPSVVAQADAAIASADAASAILIDMEVSLEGATEGSGSEQTNSLGQLTASYDLFLAAAPTATDIATAQAQSQAIEGSLYTQMTELAESCGA